MRAWLARFVTPERVTFGLAVGLALAASCSRSKPTTAKSAGGEGGMVASGEAGAGRGGGRSLGGREAAAGEAGIGAAAGQGGASGGTVPTWLAETDDWQAATTLPDCSVHVARDAAKVSPRHVFTSCGDGCETASVLPGDTPGLAYTLGTAARASSAGLDVALSQVLASEPATSLITTYTFGTGQPNLLMLVRGNCRAQLAGRASPQLLYVFPPTGEAVFKVGWLEATKSADVKWLDETTTRLLSAFDYGSSWGGIESFAEAFVAESPLSIDVTSVHQSEGVITMAAGDVGWAAWGEWSDAQGRVIAFAPGQPATVVASGSWYPALVGVSSSRLAWLGATGPSVTDGTYASARVYWCARTSTLGPCSVTEGPALPVRSAIGVLAVYDRWLALTACATDGSGCDVYLVDTSIGTAHRLERVAPDHGVQVIGISSEQLFAADFGPSERGTATFDRLLRYDLARLEAFSVQL